MKNLKHDYELKLAKLKTSLYQESTQVKCRTINIGITYTLQGFCIINCRLSRTSKKSIRKKWNNCTIHMNYVYLRLCQILICCIYLYEP